MSIYRAGRSVNEIIVHCSATPEGRDVDVSTIRRWHVEVNEWRDIGYHFVITLDGMVHRGRPINQIGAHVRNRNTGTIGVCYVGGVTNDGKLTPKDTRTLEQKEALERLLISLLQANPEISRISGHRDYAAKACPSFDATTEYRPLLARRMEEARFVDHSQIQEEGTPATQSTTIGAATITGVATTVGTVTQVVRETTENGVGIMQALGDLWPLAVAAVIVAGCVFWIIRERRRHAREDGV